MLGKLDIEITATDRCNFKCTYCFEACTEIFNASDAILDADQVIDFIYELEQSDFVKTHYEGIKIAMWGGEPTMEPRFVEKLICHFIGKYELLIYTNGSDISMFESIAAKYKSELVETIDVQVSYDGQPVHDSHRLNDIIDGEGILKNAEKLDHLGYQVSLKATMPVAKMHTFPEVWEDYKRINEEYTFSHPIAYSPTIDVTQAVVDRKFMTMRELRDLFTVLAKKEFKYYKKHGRFLMGWFYDENPKRCGAGNNMVTITTKGDVFRCHGETYSTQEVRDMRNITNIADADAIDNIHKACRSMFVKYGTYYDANPACSKCVATHCTRCFAKNVTSLLKADSDFDALWLDCSSEPDLCAMYKVFGLVSVALHDEIDRTWKERIKRFFGG